MKIAILGAGAMGSLYATYLAGQGELTLLDSYPPQVQAINQNGITRQEPDGASRTFTGLRAVASGSPIGVQDLVIVFVKSTVTYQAVEENRGLIGPDTIVLTLQNGAGNNRDIAHFATPEHIIVGTSSHNCVALGPGRISHSGCGPTNIGPDVPCPAGDAACQKLADLFAAAGLEVHIIEDIQRVLWSKLFVNCGVNALSALMDCTCGNVAQDEHLWAICRRVVAECVQVARADGTDFSPQQAEDGVRAVLLANRGGYASMCQDRRGKRKTEIDRLNGVVVQLGAQYGVPTPCNQMLVDLIHAAQALY